MGDLSLDGVKKTIIKVMIGRRIEFMNITHTLSEDTCNRLEYQLLEGAF